MRDASGFAPIDSYGVIGDRRSAALVAFDGSIDWLCWPHFDSPSVFGALLDPERGGYFKVASSLAIRETRAYYLDDTNLLITEFTTESGLLRVGDAMIRPGDRDEGDPAGREYREILRRIECVDGEAAVEIACLPRFNYGRSIPEARRLGEDILFQDAGGHGAVLLQLVSPRGSLVASADRATAAFSLRAGEVAWASLRYIGVDKPDVLLGEGTMEARWDDALRYWLGWVARGTYPETHRDIAVRSALITQLLSYAETGASVAAPTTSLPEVVGGRRNYDYRFAWVRDGSLGLAVFTILGYLDEAKQTMLWLSSLGSDTVAPLQVVYSVRGDRSLEQEEITTLSGYRDTRPIRVGNHAWSQVQPDEFGIFLDCVWTYVQQGGEMLPEFWELIERAADFVHDHWKDPNNGIWESLEQKYFVSSLVLCWAALDRAARMAEKRDGWDDKETKWRKRANIIKEYTLRYGFDEEIGSFTYTTDDKRLDASVLTAITYGMLPGNDPKSLSTVRHVREQLSRGDMLLRHLLAEEADHISKGLPAEGWKPVEKRDNPFHPCTLWLSQAYALAGDANTADAILRWVWQHASPLGLLSEEYAPDVGEARGNYPLIFSHMELFKAIYFLQQAEKRRSR